MHYFLLVMSVGILLLFGIVTSYSSALLYEVTLPNTALNFPSCKPLSLRHEQIVTDHETGQSIWQLMWFCLFTCINDGLLPSIAVQNSSITFLNMLMKVAFTMC
jgi:hypothetical protein